MKLRDLPRALGLSRPPREFGTDVVNVPIDGTTIRFARWLHPGEQPKTVTQASVDAAREILRDGDVAIDIGAHTGDSTLPLALAAGAQGVVFALEPNPYVFKVLALNASLNPDRTRIVPLMFAAMPEDGAFEFEYSDEGYCNGGFHGSISRWKHGHFSKLRVEGRNLARYLRAQAPNELTRLRFIKIDTEGYDRAVLRSLVDLVRTSRPYLQTEVYKHLSADERVGYFDDLRRLGYRLFKRGDVQYRGEPLRDPSDFSRWRHFDVFAEPEERA